MTLGSGPQYGQSYYFNQGFWLRALEEETFPKHNHCHIRVRLGSLPGFDAERVDRLLNLEISGSDPDHGEELKTLLSEELFPFIQRGSTVGGLRLLRNEGWFKAASVRGSALDLLDSAV